MSTRSILSLLKKKRATLSYTRRELENLTVSEFKKILSELEIPGRSSLRSTNMHKFIPQVLAVLKKVKSGRKIVIETSTPRAKYTRYNETPRGNDYYVQKTPKRSYAKVLKTPTMSPYYRKYEPEAGPEEHFDSDIFSEPEMDLDKTVAPGYSSESDVVPEDFIANDLLAPEYLQGDQLDTKHIEEPHSMFVEDQIITPAPNTVAIIMEKIKAENMSPYISEQFVDVLLDFFNEEQVLKVAKYFQDTLLSQIHSARVGDEFDTQIKELYASINKIQFNPIDMYRLLIDTRNALNASLKQNLTDIKTLENVKNDLSKIQNDISTLNKKMFLARSLQEIKDHILYDMKSVHYSNFVWKPNQGMPINPPKDYNVDVIELLSNL